MKTPELPALPLKLEITGNAARLYSADDAHASVGRLYLTDYKQRQKNPKLEALAKVLAAAPELLRLLNIVESRCPISNVRTAHNMVSLSMGEIAAIRAALDSAGCTTDTPLRILSPIRVRINGVDKTLGKCVVCGRNLTRSGLNKIGVRCRFEGAQYDRAGFFLYDARASGHIHFQAEAPEVRSHCLADLC